MSNENFQIQLGSASAMAFQADSMPSATFDANGRTGWSYTKMSGADKFNWYFYAGTYEAMQVKHVKNMYFCGSIDAWTGIGNEAPFFVIYTKPKGDGSDEAVWYHSKRAYALHAGSQLIRAGEKCLFYCLQNPVEDFDGIRRVPFRTRIDTGTMLPNDEVLFMTLQSDSGAVQQSTYVETLGSDMRPFDGRVGQNHIAIKLVN
tara:strand:+ start:160 stop:768 length:609 start_codon:yes stop_codon:yes gene_type:complete